MDVVVVIVDTRPQPFPSWRELIEHGMDEDMAREWSLIRYFCSPRVLQKLVEQGRN